MLPKFRCICVNAIELNNAGSYISQELGYALAWGNEYLGKLVEAGVPAALAAGLSIRREELAAFQQAFREYYLRCPPGDLPDLRCELHQS